VKRPPIAILAFVVTLPLFATGLSVHGPAVARADDASCTIQPSELDAITETEANGDFIAELNARKALLTKTLTCAKSDAQTLEDQLNALQLDDGATTLRSQFVNKLGDAENYYDLELVKVDSAGIAGTKAIARETFAWRVSNYDMLAGQAANFMLWSENQALFSVATTRLGQTRNVVNFITQTAPNSDIQNAFANAETLIKTANDENQAAKSTLLQFLPPNQSLAAIKLSLQSLSDAYKKFSDVSTIAQTLLSTNTDTK
jgi:hypothetical protein